MIAKNIFVGLVGCLSFNVALYAMEAGAETEFAAQTNLTAWDILAKEIDIADNMLMVEKGIERFRSDDVNFITITMNHLKEEFSKYGSYLQPTTLARYKTLLLSHDSYLQNPPQENVMPEANPSINPRISKKLF